MAQQGEEHRNIAPQPQTEEGGINWLYMTPLLGAPLLPLGTSLTAMQLVRLLYHKSLNLIGVSIDLFIDYLYIFPILNKVTIIYIHRCVGSAHCPAAVPED
jgi:hypothetical protein